LIGFVYNQTMKRHYLNVHASEEEKNLLKNRFQELFLLNFIKLIKDTFLSKNLPF